MTGERFQGNRFVHLRPLKSLSCHHLESSHALQGLCPSRQQTLQTAVVYP